MIKTQSLMMIDHHPLAPSWKEGERQLSFA
jgi:hypothetical protein